MKNKFVQKLMGGLILIVCLSCAGCTGIIQPQIGESGALSASGDNSTEGVASTQDDPGQGDDGPLEMPGMDQEESEPKPEMEGNVIKRFATSTEISNSMGEIQQLSAYVELYDAENADGNTALINVTLGETEKYIACPWSEEDGQYVLKIDEFTDYVTKDVDGVLTVAGVKYDFGMSGKGTIDIPLADGENQSEKITEEATEAGGEISE